jgi:autotransporter-associated beta strand protein
MYAEIRGTISDGASGTSPLTKSGGGILDLRTAINTYTGGTIINGGQISYTNERSFGAVPATAGTPTFNNNNILLDGGTIRVYSNATASFNINAARSINIGAGGGTFNIGNSSGANTLLANLWGSGPLTKIGNAVWTISSNNNSSNSNFTGDWNINTGRVNIATLGTDNLGSGTIHINGNPGVTSGLSTSMAGVTLANNIVLNANGETVTLDALTISGLLTLDGVIGGTGPVSIGSVASTAAASRGTGVVAFGNTGNNYSGGTNIGQGVLRLGASGVIPDGSAVLVGQADNVAAVNSGAGVQIGGTLDVNGMTETIGSLAGLAANGKVTLGSGTLIAGGDNTSTTFPGIMSGVGGSFTKAGGGTLTLTNANTYTGGTTVSGGTLLASNANAIGTGAPLAVNAGAIARSQAGQLTALDISSLTVAATGRVDVNDGGLVIRNGGQAGIQQATALAKTGLENGGAFDWQGPGISSTEAFNDNTTAGSVLYGVGVLQNNLNVAGSPDGTTTDATPGNEIYTSFKGRTVALNDTLVRYTYMGDADLSGDVTSTDYSLIDSGFALALSGWVNGDFDYSGSVDATDYALIDNAFAFQTGVLPEQVAAMYAQHAALFGQEYVDAFAAVQSGVVPEPATAGLLAAVLVAGVIPRRSRRRSGNRA